MKRNFWLKQLPIAFFVIILVLTTAAWQGRPGRTQHVATDTIPDRDKKMKDIEDALDQLEKSRKEMERTLQSKDWEKEMNEALEKVHFDADKIKTEIAEAMKNLDVQKIQQDVQKAIKEADLEKMKAELNQNLDKIDLQEMKGEIENAMKEVDAEKIKADVSASISKIDMDKMKLELDKIKDIDSKEVEENLKKMKPEIEKSMQQAKEGVDKAKKEFLEYKGFIDGLDRDGLIDRGKDYTIEYKNGQLTINGKKQPAGVLKKYDSFLHDRKDFTIKKNEHNFNIENN